MHPIKHFRTITKHRHLVMKNCFRVGLIIRGLTHDLSKYSFAEFWTGAKYYKGTRSPNAVQREVEGYSTAWMHHKGRNRHHFEYWTDLQPGKEGYQPIPMPFEFLVESVMDRIAASKIYKGKDYYPGVELDYLTYSKESDLLHPDTLAELMRILTMLKEKGETETFRYLKQELKQRKKHANTL